MKNTLRNCLYGSFLLLMCLFSTSVLAQKVGIGVQFGQPSGLTLKFYNPSAMSVDILAAWDLDDYFFVNVHGLWEKPLSGNGKFRFFYGPGAFLGIRDYGNRFEDEISIGISGSLGLSAWIDRLELYLQVTPRLEVIERTDADIGGGFGLRFYF
ncbi:MAG: hypothetical protein HUU01_18795 [Saprospiraceae bacterium]|nr:hypothetical protein [Saprospiraceae bacterium]